MLKKICFAVLPVLVLISCENDEASTSPLFYQMSETDSSLCVDLIFEDMREEAKKYQEDELRMMNDVICWMPLPRPKRDVFCIRNHGNFIDSIDFHGLSNDLTNSVVDFYLRNRNVNPLDFDHVLEEVEASIYPFYNLFTRSKWKKRIEDRQQEYEEVRDTKGVDSSYVEYFREKIRFAQHVYDMIVILKSDTIHPIGEMTRVEIDCPNSSAEYNRILEEVVQGFYQLRNYECMRYFSETYLSLFERAQRLKRKIDSDKLDVLKFLHPVRVIDYKHTFRATHPPPQEEFF